MARVTQFETRLRAAFERTCGPENVTRALELIRSDEHDSDETTRALALTSERAQRRDAESYHPHDTHTLVLEALCEWLDVHDSEYLGEVHMHDGPPVEYLNVGDPYVDTVLWYRDGYRGRHYHVGGWADALEWCERRGIIKRDAAE